MKAGIKKYLLICTLLIIGTYTHAKTLHEIITEEFKNIKYVATVDSIPLGNLQFINGESSHVSNKNPNLLISESEISHYVRDSSEVFTTLFCRFALCHEFAHKIQFIKFRGAMSTAPGGEASLFTECDADIVAGFIMFQIINTRDIEKLQNKNSAVVDYSLYNEQLVLSLRAFYLRVFDMDMVNGTISTHPNNRQRALAIMQGLYLGKLTGLYEMLVLDQNKQISLSDAQREQFRYIYSRNLQGLQFEPGKMPWFWWAVREATRVIHENNIFATNLIIFNKTIERDSDQYGTIFRFSFNVINQNKTDVRFSGRTWLNMTRKNLKTQYFSIAPYDATAFDTIIKPNQAVTLTGRLLRLESNIYQSQIIFPGDLSSIYSVDKKPKGQLDTTQHVTNYIRYSGWQNNAIDQIKDIVYKIDLEMDHLNDYKTGIGISNAKLAKDIAEESIYFTPAFLDTMANNQNIQLSPHGKSIRYTIDLFETSSISLMAERQRQLVKLLRETFPKYRLQPPKKESSLLSPFVYYKDKQSKLFISCINTKNIYKVSLNFEHLQK